MLCLTMYHFDGSISSSPSMGIEQVQRRGCVMNQKQSMISKFKMFLQIHPTLFAVIFTGILLTSCYALIVWLGVPKRIAEREKQVRLEDSRRLAAQNDLRQRTALAQDFVDKNTLYLKLKGNDNCVAQIVVGSNVHFIPLQSCEYLPLSN